MGCLAQQVNVQETVEAGSAPYVCMAEPTPNVTTTTTTQARLSLATLFAFLQGSDAIFPICMTIIGCLRKFQVGTSSVGRVLAYLERPVDPWCDSRHRFCHRLALPLSVFANPEVDGRTPLCVGPTAP